jgi:hypothetical protein
VNEAQEKDILRRVRGYEYLNVASRIQQDVKPAIKQLDAAIRMLPRIDRNGESECPFAAQLYVQKEQKAAKVGDELTAMRHLLEMIDEEIMRCHKNLRVVSQGSAKIHSKETGQKVSYVFAELKRQLSCAQEMSKQAKDSIEEMERVLTYSARIAHPDVPSVGVPAWTPADRKTTDKRNSSPPYLTSPTVAKPMLWPSPIPAGPPLGRDKTNIPLPPPIPLGSPFRSHKNGVPLPPPIPHPVSGTDMVLKPPKNAIHL